MKSIKILLALTILVLTACNSVTKKNDLIGIWSTYEDDYNLMVLTFYKDSMIVDAFNGGFHTNSNWTLDDKAIYLDNVRLLDTILKERMFYNYELNKSKNHLILKFREDNIIKETKFEKVDVNPIKSEY